MQTTMFSKFADSHFLSFIVVLGMMEIIIFPYGIMPCGLHLVASEGFLS
jgi:hypothetical protein